MRYCPIKQRGNQACNLKKWSQPHYLLILISIFYTPVSSAQKLASIIIDDLGNNYETGLDIINFSAPVTLAILPHTKYAHQLAKLAHKQNREVMLHLPLQPVEKYKYTPGILSQHMTYAEFIGQLKINLDSVPHISGINNHMGSLLTQRPDFMNWLMSELSKFDNLYFIDSLTSKKSIAAKIAAQHHIPNLTRDVFLDPDNKEQTFHDQFNLFISIIKRKGHAIAIAHPHKKSLEYLNKYISKLDEQGIKLVPVSKLISTSEGKTHVSCTGTACAGL